VGPPDSTHVTQLLDQINSSLHQIYRATSKTLFRNDETIDRQGFLDILSSVWSQWATKESIIKAAKRVGISAEGLNWRWMQVEKFTATESLVKPNEEISSSSKPSWQAEAPSHIRYGTADYWKHMYHAQLKISKDQAEVPVSPEELGILHVEKVKKIKKKNTRITQVQGSMEGQHILERIEEINKEEEKKNTAREERKMKKIGCRELFIRCEERCTCNDKICHAKGLRKCIQCGDVMKSKCTKKKCREKGAEMILPFCSLQIV